jgi:2-C-methyl-D-erythritol 4-phosphate cytidylyltransferase
VSVRVGVVIPAAGAGHRMGTQAKPFLELAGQPMLRRALAPFLDDARVVRIVVALSPERFARPPGWLAALAPRVSTVVGGGERADSVCRGVAVLGDDLDVILVHDAARPLVSGAVVNRAIAAAAAGRCAIAAVPAADTVQEVDNAGRIVATPERRRLWLAQTPQAFPRAVLAEACARAAREGLQVTDDAALVAHFGFPVHVVEGDPRNFKITVPADLEMAEALLAAE